MRIFAWNEVKSRVLKMTRGISFDDILTKIEKQGYFESIRHSNPNRYPNQKIMLVKLKRYIYLVPYVRTGGRYFLKTVFPSRKLTKIYQNLKEEGYEKVKIFL